MPPSMQIDNVSITNYEDLTNNLKRAAITFTSDQVITLAGGDTANALRLANVANPTTATDAANKQYVDAAIFGLAFKAPVRAVSVANADLASAYAAGSVVDGVTLVAGDRLLLAGQTNQIENGIYVVNATGAPTRADDLAAGSNASGAYAFVDEGTVYKDRGYVCISDRAAAVVGTNDLEFIIFSSRSSAMAGHGLITGTAEQLDVNVDNSSLVILADVVQVKDQGIVNAKIADATIQNAKLVNPQVTVNTARGLLNGKTLVLGDTTQLAPDFTVLPDLAADNTFTGATNTFSGAVAATSTLAVTGATTLSSTLAVTGTSTFAAAVTAPTVTGLAAPAGPTDAVNLLTMTTAINNAGPGSAARAVAVGISLTLATLVAGAVVDGVTLAVGDRLLLTGQTNGIENGVYVMDSAAPPLRASPFTTGSSAAAQTLIVKEGTLYADRLFCCTSNSGADVVDTHPLTFAPIAHTTDQLAGAGTGAATALAANTASASLRVVTDDTTMEVDPATNALRIKDAGVTNVKIADATIQNAKLVNPQVTVDTARGLLNGKTLVLGDTTQLAPDFTVLPDLAASNTFSGPTNTFSSSVLITNGTAATSQTTGALIVNGGVGVSGDLFVSSTYNMSDAQLKTNITNIPNGLEVISALRGCEFDWNDNPLNVKSERVGERTVGVIAQEVNAVAPLCVSSAGSTDDGRTYLAVDYTKLVPYLVEACKTLSEETKSLKRRCEDLEGQLETSQAKRAHTKCAVE